MLTLREKVLWFALTSRLAVLALQAISNFVIPDHHATDVFLRPKPHFEQPSGLLDKFVQYLLGGLERWDAQYFIHIAKHGYSYENTLAFFPLYPLVVRYFAYVLRMVFYGSMSDESLFLLSATVLNVAFFVKTSDVLYRLGILVLKNENMAYIATLLFCISPASIFFSAPYSETCFALLTMYGMWKCIEEETSRQCGIPFGLSAATRSNGILNVGFIIHKNIKYLLLKKWPELLCEGHPKLILPFWFFASLAPLVEASVLALAPFIGFQVHSYFLFCTPQQNYMTSFIEKHGLDRNFVLPNLKINETRQPGHWCHDRSPLAYSYIQKHYWNVGFMQYYQWKQIPNFLLALPIVLLVLIQAVNFFTQHKDVCLKLGLGSKGMSTRQLQEEVMSPDMFVFIVHAVFLTFFCLLFVHIQVTTRMVCSASPVPYWFAAYIWSKESKKRENIEKSANHGQKKLERQIMKQYDKVWKSDNTKAPMESLQNRHSRWRVVVLTRVPDTLTGKLVTVYFLSYTVIGTMLFSNFLPWT